MNEVVEALRKIEEKYRLFQQQQFTFIRALERTREEAHDLIRPVSSIVQVQIPQHKVLPARDTGAGSWGHCRPGETLVLLKGRGTQSPQEGLWVTEGLGRETPVWEPPIIPERISWLGSTFCFS